MSNSFEYVMIRYMLAIKAAGATPYVYQSGYTAHDGSRVSIREAHDGSRVSIREAHDGSRVSIREDLLYSTRDAPTWSIALNPPSQLLSYFTRSSDALSIIFGPLALLYPQ